MSFSLNVLVKKLLGLQETQDSIVTISQWVLFHQRHSKEAASTWAKYITSDPDARNSKKRLSLLYLCNDVVQQARHKRKPEFIDDFGGVLPGVFSSIFPQLDPAVQPKAERLITVWEQRHVFAAPVIADLRAAVSGASNASSAEVNSNPAAVNAGTTVVADLRLLNDTYVHLNKLVDMALETLSQVGMMSKTYLSPNTSETLPAPREYISKLNSLEQLCNSSTNTIEEMKKIRLDAIKQLDSLKANINDSLQGDEGKLAIIGKRLAALKETRSELQEMVGEDAEEPSPTYDDIDEEVPSYNNGSDDEQSPKRQKLNNNAEKKVAFSENIEIKEFRQEDESSGISIIKSMNDNDDGEYTNEEPRELSNEFTSHHKDDLELKHEHDSESDSYTPTEGNSSVNSSVLSLLSKLA